MDDGRTVAEMNLEGTPWFRRTAGDEREKEDYTDLDLKKLIREAYKRYLLAALVWAAILFAVLAGISCLWLG